MEFGDDLHEEGYLEKQGKLKFSWKKYWFVLRRDKLHYYKDPQNRNDAHAGLIDVCRAQSVRRCFQVHHGHAFEIVTKNRMHLLSADTAKACDVWVKKLQQAMQYERRNSVRLSHAHLEPQPSFSEISDDENEQPPDSYETVPNSATSDYEVFKDSNNSSATSDRNTETPKSPPVITSHSPGVAPPVPKQRTKSLKSPGPVSPALPVSPAPPLLSAEGEYYQVEESSTRTKMKKGNGEDLSAGAYEIVGAYESIGELAEKKQEVSQQHKQEEEEEELYATCEDPVIPSPATDEDIPKETPPYAKVNKKMTGESVSESPQTVNKDAESIAQINSMVNDTGNDAVQEVSNKKQQKLQKQESSDEFKWMNFDFPPIPEDPHPIVEYAESFKELSYYLQNNFKKSEGSVSLRKSEKGGVSVQKMRNSLSDEEDEQLAP